MNLIASNTRSFSTFILDDHSMKLTNQGFCFAFLRFPIFLTQNWFDIKKASQKLICEHLKTITNLFKWMQSIIKMFITLVFISTEAKNWISKIKKNPDSFNFSVSFSSQKCNFFLLMCLNIFITKLSQFFPLLFDYKIVNKSQKVSCS